MCGRLLRTSPAEVVRQLLDLASMPDVLPDRYNLAPTEGIPVVRQPGHLELLRWGLKMPEARMAGINARVESLAKPLYRTKVERQRCLIVVDGFYEWRALNGKKQPYLITRADKAPMVMAGIYDATDACAILTAPSQGVVATLHERMPVVLAANTFETWLDAGVKDVGAILAGANAEGLVCYPVSTRVNSVRADDVTLTERVEEPVVEGRRGETLRLF